MSPASPSPARQEARRTNSICGKGSTHSRNERSLRESKTWCWKSPGWIRGDVCFRLDRRPVTGPLRPHEKRQASQRHQRTARRPESWPTTGIQTVPRDRFAAYEITFPAPTAMRDSPQVRTEYHASRPRPESVGFPSGCRKAPKTHSSKIKNTGAMLHQSCGPKHELKTSPRRSPSRKHQRWIRGRCGCPTAG